MRWIWFLGPMYAALNVGLWALLYGDWKVPVLAAGIALGITWGYCTHPRNNA